MQYAALAEVRVLYEIANRSEVNPLFPGINPDGSAAPVDKRRAISAKFASTLMADAGAAMPGRLAIGFDSLTLNVPDTDVSYRQSKRQFLNDVAGANARPGWQTNELLGGVLARAVRLRDWSSPQPGDAVGSGR